MGLCLLVGSVAAAFTSPSVRGWYGTLTAPPGTPPNWAFPVAWSILYVMMAVAAWLVWQRAGIARSRHYRALRLWGWQLALNAAWTPVFFGAHRLLLALAVVVLLAVMVGWTMLMFGRVYRLAGLLLAPYLAWVCYAAWLNAGFWWLNRG